MRGVGSVQGLKDLEQNTGPAPIIAMYDGLPKQAPDPQYVSQAVGVIIFAVVGNRSLPANRAELSRAKTKAQAELSRINGEIELLGARKRRTGQLSVRESLRQTWEASESIGWRGALIDMVVERIDVFSGYR